MSETTCKIRRLKWRREACGWEAETSWGRYTVEPAKWPGALGMWYVTFRSGEFEDCYQRSLRKAKADCQSDFGRRVTECLE